MKINFTVKIETPGSVAFSIELNNTTLTRLTCTPMPASTALGQYIFTCSAPDAIDKKLPEIADCLAEYISSWGLHSAASRPGDSIARTLFNKFKELLAEELLANSKEYYVLQFTLFKTKTRITKKTTCKLSKKYAYSPIGSDADLEKNSRTALLERLIENGDIDIAEINQCMSDISISVIEDINKMDIPVETKKLKYIEAMKKRLDMFIIRRAQLRCTRTLKIRRSHNSPYLILKITNEAPSDFFMSEPSSLWRKVLALLTLQYNLSPIDLTELSSHVNKPNVTDATLVTALLGFNWKEAGNVSSLSHTPSSSFESLLSEIDEDESLPSPNPNPTRE